MLLYLVLLNYINGGMDITSQNKFQGIKNHPPWSLYICCIRIDIICHIIWIYDFALFLFLFLFVCLFVCIQWKRQNFRLFVNFCLSSLFFFVLLVVFKVVLLVFLVFLAFFKCMWNGLCFEKFFLSFFQDFCVCMAVTFSCDIFRNSII